MTSPTLPRRRRSFRRAAVVLIALVACLGAVIGAISPAEGEADGPIEIRIAGGSSGGTYAVMARAIAEACRRAGVNAEVVATEGTFDNLCLLREGGVDLALVQGDALDTLAGDRDFSHLTRGVRLVAPLYREEIHILARTDAGIHGPKQLRGKRVAVGPTLSGTHLAAKSVLDALDIDPNFGIRPRADMSYQEALSKLESGELDAMFYVAGAPAPLLNGLPSEYGRKVSLVPFTLDDVPEVSHVFWPTVVPVEVYPWMAEDVPMAATTAWLAATRRLDAATVGKITKALFESTDILRAAHPKGEELDFGLARVITSQLGERVHEGARAYYDEASAGWRARAGRLRLRSGPKGGTYDRFGTDLTEVLGRVGFTVKHGGSSGSFENVIALGRGQTQLAIVQLDALAHPQAEAFRARIQTVLPLYNEEVHLLARPGSGIRSIRDLRGKRVHAGAVRSGTYATATALLELVGLDAARDLVLDHSRAETALAALAAGELDAAFFVGGAPLGTLAGAGKGRGAFELVSLSARDVEDVVLHSELYDRATIPAGTYPFQSGDVRTISTRCALLVAPDADEDAVAQIVYTIRAAMGWLADRHPKWNEVSFSRAQEDLLRGRLPFHPGAEKALLGKKRDRW